MFAILNKSERLITTQLGDALPPGVPVAVSEETMNHPSMQEMANAGLIEVVEIQDPPPPPEVTEPPANGDTMTGGQRTQQPTPTPTPAPQQPRPQPTPQPQPQANKAS